MGADGLEPPAEPFKQQNAKIAFPMPFYQNWNDLRFVVFQMIRGV